MGYPIPTLTESEEILVAAYRALFPGSMVGVKRAYHRRRAQFLAMVMTELHAHLDSLGGDVMPDTATGSFAERWGKIVGTFRKVATPARKSDAGRVVGVATTPIEQGTELIHQTTGLRFMIGEDDVVPVGGEVDVDIIAIDTGSRTRLEAGEILDFVETPAGLETHIELQKDLDEDGFDIEQESTFKRRYLDALGEPSAGGNDADWIRWQKALEGVEQAFVYGNRAGLGTVDIVSLHAGSSDERALLEAEADDVVAALTLLGPTQVVATGGSLRHLTVVADPQKIEISVVPNGQPQWAMDWDDSTPPEVDDWDPDTRQLTFTADRPDSMKAGDRLCIHGVASDQTGEVLVIEELISTDAVKLEVVPEVDPEPTDIVYAGDDGPIPAAIAEESNTSVFDLRELAQGVGPANPDGIYGPWSGGLIREVLEGIATYARGARKATCVVPAADYEAEDFAFPDDQQIGLVVASEVLVRKAW